MKLEVGGVELRIETQFIADGPYHRVQHLPSKLRPCFCVVNFRILIGDGGSSVLHRIETLGPVLIAPISLAELLSAHVVDRCIAASVSRTPSHSRGCTTSQVQNKCSYVSSTTPHITYQFTVVLVRVPRLNQARTMIYMVCNTFAPVLSTPS